MALALSEFCGSTSAEWISCRKKGDVQISRGLPPQVLRSGACCRRALRLPFYSVFLRFFPTPSHFRTPYSVVRPTAAAPLITSASIISIGPTLSPSTGPPTGPPTGLPFSALMSIRTVRVGPRQSNVNQMSGTHNPLLRILPLYTEYFPEADFESWHIDLMPCWMYVFERYPRS